MAFVRDEIAENVPDVERQVAPDISPRGGNASPLITAKLEQAQHARAATLEGWNETFRLYLVPIHAPGHRDAVFFAERLDPHTPSIVDMARDRPDGATRRPRHCGFPEFGGQVLDQKDRNAIVGFPCVKDRISQVDRRRHASQNSAGCGSFDVALIVITRLKEIDSFFAY